MVWLRVALELGSCRDISKGTGAVLACLRDANLDSRSAAVFHDPYAGAQRANDPAVDGVLNAYTRPGKIGKCSAACLFCG